MRNFLVYMRVRTAKVVKVIHRVKVSVPKLLRFGGLWKLGVTPGGGFSAGPFSMAWSFA